MQNKLAVFKNGKIRRTLQNDEWWFSIADVVEGLTDSSDPRQYIKKMLKVLARIKQRPERVAKLPVTQGKSWRLKPVMRLSIQKIT